MISAKCALTVANLHSDTAQASAAPPSRTSVTPTRSRDARAAERPRVAGSAARSGAPQRPDCNPGRLPTTSTLHSELTRSVVVRDSSVAVAPTTRYAHSGDVASPTRSSALDRSISCSPGVHLSCRARLGSARAAVHERLASFSRLVLFDKRGTGLSDPVPVRRLWRSEPTISSRSWTLRRATAPQSSARRVARWPRSSRRCTPRELPRLCSTARGLALCARPTSRSVSSLEELEKLIALRSLG